MKYLKQETTVWLEITTLLIPSENDSDYELNFIRQWIRDNLGPDAPVHFTAFHPDWKMMHHPPTSAQTLFQARQIAKNNGIPYVHTGNIHDSQGGSTFCLQCSGLLIERDWYVFSEWHVKVTSGRGICAHCGTGLPSCNETQPGQWGSQRLHVLMIN